MDELRSEGAKNYPLAMLYMVIERYKNRDARAIYARFRAHGRMMPDGLTYVGSWIEEARAVALGEERA